MARNANLMASIVMGDIAVSIVASGTTYSPDIADDIARRAIDLWHGALEELDEFDMLGNEPEDEDEFGPVPERELQDPRIVRLMEDWGDDYA